MLRLKESFQYFQIVRYRQLGLKYAELLGLYGY